VGDHLLYRDDGRPTRAPWEAWTTLAALAAATSRVQIGPLVAATSFHAPAMVAKKAATIEEISGGRLILGLGAGWNRPDYDAFGFPYDHRVSRFEEAFTIIRTLLREGEIDFQGTYYTVDRAQLLPRGPRPGGPPLMVGSEGPRMLAITLPHVDAWNAWFTWFGNSPEGYRAVRARIDDACRAAGRDPAEVERTVARRPLRRLPGRRGTRPGRSTGPGGRADHRRAGFACRPPARVRRGGGEARPARAGPDHRRHDPGAAADAGAAGRLRPRRRLLSSPPMDELPPPIPLGATGRLEAQPMVNAVGDHAILVRQAGTTRALITGESASERDRVVVVPLDDDVELRMDGDALAVWLARGSVSSGVARVPGWASAIGLVAVLGFVGLAVLGSVTAITWLLEALR
jgi:alkanesulfonate monooxygenase SsuD/methylene tetrahydromethanopterin reductase-like flavin-dependent oxidoreductase (luciferase family)